MFGFLLGLRSSSLRSTTAKQEEYNLRLYVGTPSERIAITANLITRHSHSKLSTRNRTS